MFWHNLSWVNIYHDRPSCYNPHMVISMLKETLFSSLRYLLIKWIQLQCQCMIFRYIHIKLVYDFPFALLYFHVVNNICVIGLLSLILALQFCTNHVSCVTKGLLLFADKAVSVVRFLPGCSHMQFDHHGMSECNKDEIWQILLKYSCVTRRKCLSLSPKAWGYATMLYRNT